MGLHYELWFVNCCLVTTILRWNCCLRVFKFVNKIETVTQVSVGAHAGTICFMILYWLAHRYFNCCIIVNIVIVKTKIMICSTGLYLLQDSDGFPFTVCRTSVGTNSIFCNGCKYWMHKKCSGLLSVFVEPDFRCSRCRGDGSPSWQQPAKWCPTWSGQVGSCRFLLLPRNHYECEDCFEDVKGAATGQ